MPTIPARVCSGFAQLAEASWDERDSILEVDEDHLQSPRIHFTVEAKNVEQIVLGLSGEHIVQSVEVISGVFKEVPFIKAPSHVLTGRLELPFTLSSTERQQEHRGREVGGRDWEIALTCDFRRTLFHIEIESRAGTTFYATNPHLVFGIADGLLTELWVLRPDPC